MNIIAADWIPYRLPLRQPWATARGEMPQRQGRLLRLQTADGRIGWGDCAPLPEFGIDEATATAYAETSAHLDLATQAAGQPLGQWLAGQPLPETLRVNAMAGPLTTVTTQTLANLAAEGFAIVKIKVGLAPWREEQAQILTLFHQLPDRLQLRLDANGAWDKGTAREVIAFCNQHPVEGLEEPLANPTLATLAELQSLARFPLALDESAMALGPALLADPPVRRLILKPPRQGDPLAAFALGQRVQQAGLECIVTSSLESACGLTLAAHLAAALAPEATHGLATACWFTQDTGLAPTPQQGRLLLPTAHGLGFIANS